MRSDPLRAVEFIPPVSIGLPNWKKSPAEAFRGNALTQRYQAGMRLPEQISPCPILNADISFQKPFQNSIHLAHLRDYADPCSSSCFSLIIPLSHDIRKISRIG